MVVNLTHTNYMCYNIKNTRNKEKCQRKDLVFVMDVEEYRKSKNIDAHVLQMWINKHDEFLNRVVNYTFDSTDDIVDFLCYYGLMINSLKYDDSVGEIFNICIRDNKSIESDSGRLSSIDRFVRETKKYKTFQSYVVELI